MRHLRSAVKGIYWIVLKMKARNAISRLYGEVDWGSRLIASALMGALQNDAISEEKVWIDKIESLREELNSSTSEVSIVDYGAGKPGLNLTDEEMYQGRVITSSVGDICRTGSKPYFWSFLLFRLIREFRPSVCLELGTCLGISASFQAAALKLNQAGKIVTLEGAELLASLAQRNFQSLGLDNVSIVIGRFQDTLDGVLNEHAPLDYAFIDGHHDEKATMTYFEQIFPFLSDKAIIVFDDISWSEGMKRVWKGIEMDERVKISVDLRHVGICIIDRGIEGKQSFKIPMI